MSTSKWDERVQTFHGGQEWCQLTNYHDDFSVTTNFLGPPRSAVEAAIAAVQTIEHYPPSDFEPALTRLAEFVAGDGATEENCTEEYRRLMLLGNGASELIELVCRLSPGTSWRPGPEIAQYKEYERSSEGVGKKRRAADDTAADMIALVNPCNPTGSFMTREQLKIYIMKQHPERFASPDYDDGGGINGDVQRKTVIIDESMQPWIGPHWRQESMVSERDWVKELSEKRRIDIFVIHSWTKLWACPGIRLGSVLCPTSEICQKIKAHQVPWSVNSPALAFLEAAIRDRCYLARTWDETPKVRAMFVKMIKGLHPSWQCLGEPFLSYVWVDCGSDEEAAEAVRRCRDAGVPIRSAKSGYQVPSHVRVGLRPKSMDVLRRALEF